MPQETVNKKESRLKCGEVIPSFQACVVADGGFVVSDYGRREGHRLVDDLEQSLFDPQYRLEMRHGLFFHAFLQRLRVYVVPWITSKVPLHLHLRVKHLPASQARVQFMILDELFGSVLRAGIFDLQIQQTLQQSVEIGDFGFTAFSHGANGDDGMTRKSESRKPGKLSCTTQSRCKSVS
jgi:hypothetical protein